MYRIGVDLGGTNIAVGVINDSFEIIARAGTKTNIPRPAEEIFADIVKCAKEAVAKAGIEMNEVASIGIGTPGSCDKKNGVILYANNLYFDNVPAAELVNKELPEHPVVLIQFLGKH